MHDRDHFTAPVDVARFGSTAAQLGLLAGLVALVAAGAASPRRAADASRRRPASTRS